MSWLEKWTDVINRTYRGRKKAEFAEEAHDMPEPKERGDVVWHSSEEDGGPDVGLHVAIGGGVTLWVGEITRREWEELPDEGRALGSDNGWWIIVYHGGESKGVLGRCVSPEDARDLVDTIAAGLRA